MALNTLRSSGYPTFVVDDIVDSSSIDPVGSFQPGNTVVSDPVKVANIFRFFHSQSGCSASADVLGLRYRLKMIGIYAGGVAAQVIHVFAGVYGAMLNLIEVTMRRHVLSLATQINPAISFSVATALPDMTGRPVAHFNGLPSVQWKVSSMGTRNIECGAAFDERPVLKGALSGRGLFFTAAAAHSIGYSRMFCRPVRAMFFWCERWIRYIVHDGLLTGCPRPGATNTPGTFHFPDYTKGAVISLGS